MAPFERRSLDRPDEVRRFPHGEGVLARLGPLAGAAGASEVLTTLMTRMLVEPGAFEFDSRGPHELKGLPAPIELFAVRPAGVTGRGATPE